MAVALATLPLKSLLVDDGDGLLAAATGSGRAACVAGAFRGDATGVVAFLLAALVEVLAAGFFVASVFGAGFLAMALLGAGFFATTFPTAAFLAGAFLTGAFLAGALLAGAFLIGAFLIGAFLTGAFLTGAFLTGAFLPDAFFAGVFLAAAFFAGAAFFAEALLAAGFGAAFFTATRATGFWADLADDLLALFTIRSLPVAAFALPAAALVDVLPLCALVAVELALVFAISLHLGWPWRPGVIADVLHTGKPVSGILVPLHAACRSGNVNILTRLILWLLRLYKRWLSPLLGTRCRFHPTCSDYARIAVTRFGPGRGSLLAAWRLLRCQPLCDGGEDPVPEHFRFRRCHDQEESHDSH